MAERTGEGGGEALLRWVAYAMMGFTALALAWVLYIRTHPSPAQALGLHTLWKVPAFSLTDQAGRPFGTAQLAGKVAVVDFIYTRCGASCPTLTAQMAKLQAAFKGQAGLQFVSISVDPLHDTPAVLARYGRQFGADFGGWAFLTGPPARVDALMQVGFKVPVVQVQVDEAGSQVVDIPHTSSLALLDRQGRIRAFYEGIEEDSWPKLTQALRVLLAER